MYAEVIVKWVKIFDARQEARTKFSIAVDMHGLLVERIRLEGIYEYMPLGGMDKN